ncbi:MAG: helix-turn-helix domain-containing protein [Lentisphaeria bacterium]|nr:helix-turn-helix domain-containing protein [Lentisphaeria bacterium]
MNNTIPAVDKSVQLLLALAEREMTQAELSAELGIAMSTAYRILMTLQAHCWVRKHPGGVYSLAEGLLGLTHGLSQEIALIEKAGAKVAEIAEKYQIACKISVRKDDRQLTCFRAEPPGPVALTGQSGSTFPLIEGSVGAALLAEESEATLASLVRTCEADIPEKRDPKLLYAAVREVRERGTVLNLRKNRWNIAAFSIPVHSPGGRVIAALTLIGSAEDFSGEKQRRRWEKIMKTIVSEFENN